MIQQDTLIALQKIFTSHPNITCVYLFGSYAEKQTCPGDVDIAVLLTKPPRSTVSLYMELYPDLAKLFSPIEVDLLFLNSAPLPLTFEIISTGKVIYCKDEDLRTDFEYIVSGRYMDFRYHLKTARLELFETIMEGTANV